MMREEKRRFSASAIVIALFLFLCSSFTYAQGREEPKRDWSFLTDSKWTVYNIDWPIGVIEFQKMPQCEEELVKIRYNSGSFVVFCHYREANEYITLHRDDVFSYEFNTNMNGMFLRKTWGQDPVLRSTSRRIDEITEETILGKWDNSEYRKVADSEYRYYTILPELKGTIIDEGTYLIKVTDNNTLETDNTFGDDHLIIKVESEERLRIIPQFKREGGENAIKEVILTRIR